MPLMLDGRLHRVVGAQPRIACGELLSRMHPSLYDVSDEVATAGHAEAPRVWQALMNADMIALGRRVPLVGVLGAVRVLPEGRLMLRRW